MTKKRIRVLIHKTINPKIRQGEITLVSYGYARNYLIPQKIASVANQNIINKSLKHKTMQSQKKLFEYNLVLTTKNLLEHINKFSIKRKASANYRFFGSITPNNVSQVILATTGILINKKQVSLSSIRKIGLYKAQLLLPFDITATIKIHILPIYG